MGQFSPDQRWWLIGDLWMPTTSPDGLSARWDGLRWVRQPEGIGGWALVTRVVATVGLLFAEAVYLAIVLVVFGIDANDLANGSAAGSDVELIIGLAIGAALLPGLCAALLALMFRRAWWELSLVAAWPLWGLLILLIVTPGTGKLESALALVAAGLVVLGIGWLAAFGAVGSWRVSPDGDWWGRPGEWYTSLTVDGASRWDGLEWRHDATAAPPEVVEVEDPDALPANREGRVTRGQLSLRVAGFGWASVRAPWITGFWGFWIIAVVFPPMILFFLAVSAVALIFVPIAAAVQSIDSLSGVQTFEGELSEEGSMRLHLPDSVVWLRCPRRMRERLVRGTRYRVFRTRLMIYVVNYERLNPTF
jgi:hypothetical protein